MSWLRKGMPLKFFKRTCPASVYFNGVEIVHSGAFDDDCTLCELVYHLALDSSHDEQFARQVMGELVKRFKLEDELREKPLDCHTCKGCPEKLSCPRIGK